MPVFVTAGAKIYIGDVHQLPSEDVVAGDFSADTWTEIKEVESVGSFGDTAAPIPFAALGSPRDRTLKGTRSAGTMELVVGIDYSDAGQLELIAAEKADDNYAFKVEFNDAPAGGTPSIRYFVGLVMSAAEALDSANNVMKLNSSIAINSNVVRVAAAA